MGGMFNLFDLSAGMSGNKLLSEKAHRDGSLAPRSRPDVGKKVSNPIVDRVEDRTISSDLRRTTSNKKSNGTPMKMLIAQEMSKEMEPKHKPPNVVARLMGLDALPAQQSVSTAQRSLPEGFLQNHSPQPGTTPKYQQQENGFADKEIPYETKPSWAYTQKQKEYKDVYEVWQQSSKTDYMKDQQRQKGRYNETPNDKKMALVRQKFIEAKRLATDEKLRQSKEFQDALEVLSSNRDLFLKFLQEPNSLFSKHIFEFQSIPPQTKHIAVLKPSKPAEIKGPSVQETRTGKQIKKQQQMVETNGWEKNKPSRGPTFVSPHQADDSSHPTRIVVLKPSPGKTQDIKVVVSSPTSSPRSLHDRDFYEELEANGPRSLTEVAKDITRHMRENLSSSQRDRDRVSPSSILSNGYVRDESSFTRSLETEYLEEENLSDSEAITPTSRHSWDYINRQSSPYSSSSFSRVSYSSESSVSREAKKRLSERWAMVTSSGSSQEQRPVFRNSSTLGEVLAKDKTVRSSEEATGRALNVSSSRSCGGEQDIKGRTTRLLSSTTGEGVEENSARNLSRSRSVPVSSTVYEKVVLDVEAPDAKVGTSVSVATKEVVKSKSGKSSFKGKVSSLFFSRNKKGNKEKSGPAPSVGSRDECQSTIAKMPGDIVPEISKLIVGRRSDDISQCVTAGHLEEGKSLNLGGLSHKTSYPSSIWVEPNRSTFSAERDLSPAKSGTPENSTESQDQPSPISVLEAPFEDEVNTPEPSETVKSQLQEPTANLHRVISEHATQSPTESVSRSLSWDDAISETSIPKQPEQSAVSSEVDREEQEWFSFIQTILSATSLNQKNSDAVFAEWHSPESPLDPSLLDRWIDGSKCKQWNMNRRLLFDCTNTALADMTSCGAYNRVPGGSTVMDEVWSRVREWFPKNASHFSSDMDHNMVVDGVLRKEMCGRGWVDLLEREANGIGEEIEAEVLEKLVEEALAELTCGLK